MNTVPLAGNCGAIVIYSLYCTDLVYLLKEIKRTLIPHFGREAAKTIIATTNPAGNAGKFLPKLGFKKVSQWPTCHGTPTASSAQIGLYVAQRDRLLPKFTKLCKTYKIA